jgi:hypothetical protein
VCDRLKSLSANVFLEEGEAQRMLSEVDEAIVALEKEEPPVSSSPFANKITSDA